MPLVGEKIETTIDDFGSLVRKNCLLVDKSLMIKDFLDGQDVSLITRPRRFGKSINMSMLNHFLAPHVYGNSTQGMFNNFAIARVDEGAFLEQHQGKYPVISISFKDIKEMTLKSAIDKIRDLIQKLYREHLYVIKTCELNPQLKSNFDKYCNGTANEAELENSLQFLSEFLYTALGKKVFILIDEYDTPLSSAYEYKYDNEMSLFMRNLFSAALKSNPFLEKGLMTGILRISQNTMLSGLNNLKIYTVMDSKYNQYFGFTEEEVCALLKHKNITVPLENVRNYYNGYIIGGLTLYNPWSLINFLDNKVLGPYWLLTSNDKLLKTILINSTDVAKSQISNLIQNKTIEGEINVSLRYEDLMKNPDTLWSLLLFCGYLKVEHSELSQTGGAQICQLKIPNQEIKSLYIGVFSEWLKEKIGYTQYSSFLKTLVAGNVDAFTKNLTGYLLACTNALDFQTESEFHSFVLGLLASITETHLLYSNQSYGIGRPDCLLIPKEGNGTQGLILEFKHLSSKKDDIEKLKEESKQLAKSALNQIDMRGYAFAFQQHTHVKQVLKVGIAFIKRVVTAVTASQQLEDGELLQTSSEETIFYSVNEKE